MIIKTFLKVSLLSSLLVFVSCGQNSEKVVTDIRVGAMTTEQGLVAEFNSVLNLGNLTLPTIQFSVFHPKTGLELGALNLAALFSGGNELGLLLNVTNVYRTIDGDYHPIPPQLPGGVKMPNGQPIPVGGLRDTPVIELPIGKTKARAYIALGRNVAMFGVAVSIKEFDGLGAAISGANLFPTFNINGIRGVAGIFTGGPGENGIAIFVDMGSVIDPTDIGSIFSRGNALATLSPKSVSITPLSAYDMESELVFIDQRPDANREKKLKMGLYKLHKKNTKLSVQ